MLEREMEDLLWNHPDSFFAEPLKPLLRQPSSEVGRADLVFEDRLGRLLVIEIKRGKLQREAISQVIDYFGMVKNQFPDRAVEMMVIAHSIPSERRVSLEQFNISHREISEKRFREVAAEVQYIFKSEVQSPLPAGGPTTQNQSSNSPFTPTARLNMATRVEHTSTGSAQQTPPAPQPIADFAGRKRGDTLLLNYFTTNGGQVNKGSFVAVIDHIESNIRARMSHYYPDMVEHSWFRFETRRNRRVLLAEQWGDAPTIATEVSSDHPQLKWVPSSILNTTPGSNETSGDVFICGNGRPADPRTDSRPPHPVQLLKQEPNDWPGYYSALVAADEYWRHCYTNAAYKFGIFQGDSTYIETIRRAQLLMNRKWTGFSYDDYCLLLGLTNKDGYRYELLGSMSAAGRAKQFLLNGTPEQRNVLRELLEPVIRGPICDNFPAVARTTLERITEFRGFGPAVATRILALARPEVLVSVTALSRHNLSVISGIPVSILQTATGYETLVRWMMDRPWWNTTCPTDRNEMAVWLYRGALVDSFTCE